MITRSPGIGSRSRLRTKIVRVGATILFLLYTAHLQDAEAGSLPLWSREISFHPVGGYGPEDRFSLRGVTQEGLHLTGECAYYQIENQNPSVATIEGTKTPDGEFWPDVTAQVKNERSGKWETIAKPFNCGHRASVTIKPGEFNPKLLVSLDFFLSVIGKAKLGRVVLKTGEAATFELKYLLEPDLETATKGDK